MCWGNTGAISCSFYSTSLTRLKISANHAKFKTKWGLLWSKRQSKIFAKCAQNLNLLISSTKRNRLLHREKGNIRSLCFCSVSLPQQALPRWEHWSSTHTGFWFLLASARKASWQESNVASACCCCGDRIALLLSITVHSVHFLGLRIFLEGHTF